VEEINIFWIVIIILGLYINKIPSCNSRSAFSWTSLMVLFLVLLPEFFTGSNSFSLSEVGMPV
jgi:hypothetical protein